MKILLLDNSSITLNENKYLIEPRTGDFTLELSLLGNEINFFGQITKETNTVHSFNLNEHKINVSGIWRRKNKIYNYILLYIKSIPQIIKSDFIYMFYPTSLKYVAFIAWLFRKNYGIYIRGSEHLTDKTAKWIYNHSSVTFTVTDYYTNLVRSHCQKHPKHAYTIRPMIPYNETDIIKNRIYILKEEINLLFLGRLVYDKGIEELLIATKNLLNKGYNIKLNIVGDGAFMNRTKELLLELNIENNVSVHGSVYDLDKVREFYKKADLYVLPTYYPEGFPRTLYEAMIFGTPIVTTFVSSIPALMKDRYNCIEVETRSVEDLTKQLEFALTNYSTMGEYAKNASKMVEKIVTSKRLTHAEHLNKVITEIK